MKFDNRIIFIMNKARFFLWFMGGLELYQPNERQLRIWLDGGKN